MRYSAVVALAVLLSLSSSVGATLVTFSSDPFVGTTALTTPGRQVVAGEPSISFSIASDVFAFNAAVFGTGNQVLFANGLVENLPTSGVNVVVLQTLDNDSNSATAFGAGNAANLIADQITSAGAGFFIYFNSGLGLPRLVYSTDLSDNTSDLAILARMTNLSGQSSALSTFTESNFAMIPETASVPEPDALTLLAAPGALWAFGYLGYILRRKKNEGQIRTV